MPEPQLVPNPNFVVGAVETFGAGGVLEPGWTQVCNTTGGPEPVMAVGEAPLQRTPLTSSDERMHVLDETCWCLPDILAIGQGDDFRILEIAHRGQLGAGDQVAVDDPELAQLAEILAAAGEEPAPNNEGVIGGVYEDGSLLIVFDDGVAAPYPATAVRRIA